MCRIRKRRQRQTEESKGKIHEEDDVMLIPQEGECSGSGINRTVAEEEKKGAEDELFAQSALIQKRV